MYVVIGYGNALRRDDGAGLILAQEIADVLKNKGKDVVHISAHQLDPELVYAFVGAEGVIFVDAGVYVGDPMVRVVPIGAKPLSHTVGHQMAPEMLLLLANALLNTAFPAWLVRVPGWDFEFGEGIGTKTQHALDQFRQTLVQDWHTLFSVAPQAESDATVQNDSGV